MDYRQHQDAIKAFIETNLPNALNEMGLKNLDAYIDDFLDFDKYTKSRQLFYDFGVYQNETLTNETKQEEFEFSIYLVFKQDKTENLKKNMLDYATAFYNMFDDTGNNLGGIADYGEIPTVRFYSATAGDLKQKVAELIIKLYTERN